MSDIRAALRARLLASPAITAIVSSGDSPDRPRIFPQIMRQGETRASVVMNLISQDVAYHMLGQSDLVGDRVQIDTWASKSDDATALGRLVMAQLSGFQGDVSYVDGSSPQPSVFIDGIFVVNAQSAYDDATKLFGVRRDFQVWYK